MEPDIKKLNQLLLSGSCCSQALVSLGLTLKGEENPEPSEGICITLPGSQKRAYLRSFDRCGDDDGAL